jgi:hypothetical protein
VDVTEGHDRHGGHHRIDRETEEALHQAEAAARRGADDAALLLAEVERATALVARGRAELEASRDDDERLAREDAERARSGELGRARQVVQQRIDRDQTTWAAVMGDVDQHWSAVEVRGQVVTDLRRAIDLLEEQDPEFRDLYRSAATGRDPAERPGEWGSLGPVSGAEPGPEAPVDPRPGRLGPAGGGTW